MNITATLLTINNTNLLGAIQIFAETIPISAWIALSMGLLLLLASAFMSSSEVAYFSLSPSDIESIKDEETAIDAELMELLKNPEKLLATILIGNNIVNIAIVILTGYAFNFIFDFGANTLLNFLFNTVILTLLLLLFGEIVPKVYTQSQPLKFSRFSVPIMRVISKLLNPLSSFLVSSTKLITKRMQGKGYDISVDDLSHAVDLIEGEKPEDKAMFEDIVNFSNRTASEIMVPRIDMCAVDSQWDFEKVLAHMLESGYSRIPVYKDSQDNIKGILYIKDLLPHKHQAKDFAWQGLMRKAFFVPENKPLDDLLEELRSNKVHISIVVDEYGGTSGVVTMEDILEEIVGDISDEYDTEELPYESLPDGSFLFDAKTPIGDVCRLLDIDSDEFGKSVEDVDTLGGLFLEIKQDLPRLNDKVMAGKWQLCVKELVKFRIISLKLTPPK